MSMSEFDPRLYEPEDSFADRPMLASGLPDDFSEEDLAFAQELGALFSLEKEEMPPLFVTTLLDAENSRFEPVRPGLEQKTYVRVFRRLKLHRSLIRSVRVSLWQGFKDVLPARRSYLVGACVCVCFMLMTMMVTSTAFASGLVYLFAGPHSGVVQYRDAPPVGRALPQQPSSEQQASAAPALSDEKQLDLIQASRLLQFPIYWPSLPDNYTVSKLYLYDGSDQTWTDGPLLMFVCTYVPPAEDADDTDAGAMSAHSARVEDQSLARQLIIWEFKPLGDGKVLQGVKLGAAHQVLIGANKQAAIYVDGQWVSINKSPRKWVYDGSGELIYERSGVIFWIQGYGDGISRDLLVNIATSLHVFDVNHFMRTARRIESVTHCATRPAGMTVSQISDNSNPDRPAIIVVGADDDP